MSRIWTRILRAPCECHELHCPCPEKPQPVTQTCSILWFAHLGCSTRDRFARRTEQAMGHKFITWQSEKCPYTAQSPASSFNSHILCLEERKEWRGRNFAWFNLIQIIYQTHKNILVLFLRTLPALNTSFECTCKLPLFSVLKNYHRAWQRANTAQNHCRCCEGKTEFGISRRGQHPTTV